MQLVTIVTVRRNDSALTAFSPQHARACRDLCMTVSSTSRPSVIEERRFKSHCSRIAQSFSKPVTHLSLSLSKKLPFSASFPKLLFLQAAAISRTAALNQQWLSGCHCSDKQIVAIGYTKKIYMLSNTFFQILPKVYFANLHLTRW